MAGQGHKGPEVFQGAGRDQLRVFPIGGPGDGELRLVSRDVVEELAGVVVFGKVGEAGGRVCSGKVSSVEGTGEVLRDGPAERSARVNTDAENVHLVNGGEVGGVQGGGNGGVFDHGHGDEVRTFVLET